MSNTFTRIVAEIKFLRMYTCVKCGAMGQGDTERMEIDCGNPIDIFHRLVNYPPRPQHMPVGWSSYTYGIKCPLCIGVEA